MITHEIIDACPLCNNRLKFVTSNYGVEDLKNYIQIYKCSVCGTNFKKFHKEIYKKFLWYKKFIKNKYLIENLQNGEISNTKYKLIEKGD